MNDTRLTDKQKAFCENYIIDFNATQAAIRAGYSEKTANRIASENLSKLGIQSYLSQLMESRAERVKISQDEVLKELQHIAFDDIKNYLEFKTVQTVVERTKAGEPIIDYRTIVDMRDSNGIDTRNIQEISVGNNGVFKFKLYNKDNALIQLGKHLGLFKEKVEIIGNLNAEREKEIEEFFRSNKSDIR